LSHATAAEPIEMPFGAGLRVPPKPCI